MAPKKPTKKNTGLGSGLAGELNQLNNALGGTPTKEDTGPGSPSALGISKSDASLAVPFALPNQVENIPAPSSATTNKKGQLVASYADVVEQYYKLDSDELKYVQDQMLHANLISGKNVTGKPNDATYDAWKKLALDSANSGTSFTTLLNMGASSGDYGDLIASLQSAQASAMSELAGLKQGTYPETDPNQIKQAVSSAFASIGEAVPGGNFLDKFVDAFHQKEGNAESSELQNEKANDLSALGTIQSEESAAEAGRPNQLQSLEQQSAGPTDVVGKSTPNLDAEAMAQAKANDPAQYYATQSSYLYGLLLDDIRGTPNYQTAPTAPSETAPGGAVTGTPLIATGS